MGSPRILSFFDPGLGNSSYLIAPAVGSEAAVIDPQRDVDQYLNAAKGLGVEVTHVFDTHLHADFVSGARELAELSGAEIAASAGARAEFAHRPLREGDRVDVGDLVLTALETPGHSPEHLAVLLSPRDRVEPQVLFSGGALMVGGAARTDLLGEALSVPLARQLYHTLHEKLLKLPDSVQVLPTHGAGSFCAAPVSKERASTIGKERASNPLAQPQTEEEFVRRALSGLPSYPVYFREMRVVNQRGPRVFRGLPPVPAWTAGQVREWVQGGGAVVDVRSAAAFAAGHIPQSYSMGTDVWIETWAGWMIPFGTPLVFLADTGEELDDAVRQVFRIGYDDLRGHLRGGMAAWRAAGLPMGTIPSLNARELRERLASRDAPIVLDIRFDKEWKRGHIPGATHMENGRLAWEDLPFPPEGAIAVTCATGGRSMTGISVLARRGYRHLYQVQGGFTAWAESGLPVERS